MIEMQLAFQRRHGALHAIHPFAHPTGNADRFEGSRIAEIERVGVDEILRMGNLAAECDGVTRPFRIEAGAGLFDLVAMER